MRKLSKTRAFEAANPHLPKCPSSPLLAAQWRVKHGIDPAPPAAISLREKYEQAMAEKRAALAVFGLNN
jgi:hypothetical protein